MIHRIGSEIISTNTYNYPNGIWILFSKKKKNQHKEFYAETDEKIRTKSGISFCDTEYGHVSPTV